MKPLAKIILASLGLQFILGMLANFYVEIPKIKPWLVFHHWGYVLVHALNGVLLLVLGIIFLQQALTKKQEQRPAIGGLVCIIVAFIAGELFVARQSDIYSLIMALAFLGAFANYLQTIFR